MSPISFPSTSDMANIAFLLAGLLFGALSLIGFLDAVRGTPVKKVLPFGPDLPAEIGRAHV